jgi:hypothetical protein
MTVIARGSKQVKALEQSLGGTPPKAAVEKARAALTRRTAEAAARQAAHAKAASEQAEQFRRIALPHLTDDDRQLARLTKARQTALARRAKARPKPPKPPKAESFEAQVAVGSIQAIKVPPYDVPWTNPSGTGSATADAGAGTYSVGNQSFGDGSKDAGAGVAVWFFAPADDPVQRVAFLLDYGYDWFDSSAFYVAHSSSITRIGVWDSRTQGWASMTPAGPSWNDGTGWTEDHSGSDEGRMSVQAFFPAQGGQWYLVWLFSNLHVYGDSGFGGFGAASGHLSASVPFVVFGGL